MKKSIGLVGTGFVACLLFGSSAALALHENDPRTPNMKPLGHNIDVADLLGIRTGNANIHTDLAFQGEYAYQGNWNGFRILNIDNPKKPELVSFTRCDGDQGDVSVYKDLLVRSTNSPNPGGRECGGVVQADGFEGLHIFDIDDKKVPKLIATVPIAFGSHTHTLVPDLENDRLLVYNATSSGATQSIAIIEISLDDPASATQVGSAALVGDGIHDCHDISVFTADVNRAVCAGDAEANVFDISDLANPVHLYNLSVPGVGDGTTLPDGTTDTVGWHSASFSWDGELIVLTSEPGGGVGAECESTDAEQKREAFFFNTSDGSMAGSWVLPRPQDGANENCTVHNYNTVPLKSGRRILISGNYQAGTSAVDFTDPANAFEFAWSDPEPIEGNVIAGGVWSSYWYNGLIYETNIEEGLNIFRVKDSRVKGDIDFDRINPQTQTCRVVLSDDDDDDDGDLICDRDDDDDDDDEDNDEDS